MIRRLALIVALLAATPATADPPMWRVHGSKGGEVVLFGSVHVLTPGLDWKSPALDEALAHAQSVWFEVPVDPAAGVAANRALEASSKLAPGATLTALLTPDGRARLARVGPTLGFAAGALDPYKPWFAEVALTLMALRREGASADAGVEQALSRAAPPTAERHAFETPEDQLGFLSGGPLPEQAASLEDTLRQIEEEPAAFAELQKAWVDGDVATIVREGVEPLRRASPGTYRRLVLERNRRWAVEIERLLKRPERAFIVVGVGHLVGPDSVPALLRRRGIAVEGP